MICLDFRWTTQAILVSLKSYLVFPHITTSYQTSMLVFENAFDYEYVEVFRATNARYLRDYSDEGGIATDSMSMLDHIWKSMNARKSGISDAFKLLKLMKLRKHCIGCMPPLENEEMWYCIFFSLKNLQCNCNDPN